jgi:two-component system, OmpR family, sensor kinase
MSLSARLSWFALTGLTIILAGFSAAVFLLFQRHLSHQVDLRLDTAMHTLVAAIEVHPHDVEWEPLERRITLGQDAGDDQVRWMVHDGNGKLIDCSENLGSRSGPNEPGSTWRYQVRRVRAGEFHAEEVGSGTEVFGEEVSHRLGLQFPANISQLPADRTCQCQAFTLTVGVPWGPVRASLWQLAATLAAVSGGIWLFTAVFGRWLCSKALRPVTQMAASARSLRAGDPGLRLAISATGDELEDLGSAFNELLSRLHDAYERQRRFSGDAAHQLRTPLTALLGQVEVALRHPRSDVEYRQVLEVVQRRSLQLRQIVEVLLFLARADATPRAPELEDIELRPWLERYLEQWQDHERSSDLRLSDSSADGFRLRAHGGLLAQLLDALLDNAFKYSAPGAPITLRAQTEAGGLNLTVQDEGCGIPAEDIPHVCEPFFRSSQARQGGYQGFGLGLAVAERIVTALDARLTIDSAPGQGSRFTVWLPGTSAPARARGIPAVAGT